MVSGEVVAAVATEFAAVVVVAAVVAAVEAVGGERYVERHTVVGDELAD